MVIRKPFYPETLLRVTLDFIDACSALSLALTAGPGRFAKFREVLGGPVRDKWDDCVITVPPIPRTLAGFEAALDLLIARYFKPTATADQTHYLETVKKPFRLTTMEVADRLSHVNRMMRWFPGNNGDVPFDELKLKHVFYNMMLTPWKLTFSGAGIDINDPNYRFHQLARYMETQEEVYNARQQLQQGGPPRSNGDRRPYPNPSYPNHRRRTDGRFNWNYTPMGSHRSPHQFQHRPGGRGGRFGRGFGQGRYGGRSTLAGRGRGGRFGGRFSGRFGRGGAGRRPVYDGCYNQQTQDVHLADYSDHAELGSYEEMEAYYAGHRQAMMVPSAEANAPFQDNFYSGHIDPHESFHHCPAECPDDTVYYQQEQEQAPEQEDSHWMEHLDFQE